MIFTGYHYVGQLKITLDFFCIFTVCEDMLIVMCAESMLYYAYQSSVCKVRCAHPSGLRMVWKPSLL